MFERKPLSNFHIMDSVHLEKVSIAHPTANSYRDKAPDAQNWDSIDTKAAAIMCQYAYSHLNHGRKETADLEYGWKPMSEEEVNSEIENGLYRKFERKRSGFNSMLFKKTTNGVDYYAYCTEGTEMSSLKDWFSNISQGLVGLSPQHTYSVQIAKRLDKAIGDRAVLWFIGHSLGGGLAANNSLATGRHAITFNAAGLNILRVKTTILLNKREYAFHYKTRIRNIHAFVLEGEILNGILGKIAQPAYGTRQEIKYKGEKKNAGERHGLVSILDVMGIKHYWKGNYK